jgi:predicted Zn-dependent protease
MNRGWTAAVIAAAALLAPPYARAQTDPRLQDAVRLAQEGHSDSARAVVGRLLSATPPTDSLYPEILYAEAMVASDAGEMRTHLQRIAVEYGGSSWADDGILRLVQMDYATHNLSGAAKNLEKLRSDYPASPLLPQASYWAGRVYFDQSNPTDACRWLAEGLAQSEGDIELQNQLRYLNQRCTTAAVSDTGAMPRDSAMAAPGPPGKTVYRVQIAAVASGDAAADTEKKARALGLTVETILEKNLYKVRAGRYSSRTEAQAAAAGLKVKLGGNPFVVAEP